MLCFGGEAKAFHGNVPVVLPCKYSAISKQSRCKPFQLNSGAIGGFNSKEATHGKKGGHSGLKGVKMRLSAFQDAAANSRSALKPDLRLLSTTNGARLIGLCNRGDDHANIDYRRSRKLASEPME
jgi:hypothetical protein